MSTALKLDSLTPPSSFDHLSTLRAVDVGRHERGNAIKPLRPYVEVAALLVITGLAQEVPSVQQVIDIERRAFRKLRSLPQIRALYRDCIGHNPASHAETACSSPDKDFLP